MKKILNGICIVLAFLFLGIGAVGAVLPILPTTPFLLLAAFLFAKSSEKFHRWFVETNLYKKYIKQAVKNKAMSKQAKKKVLLALGVIFVIGFLVSPIWHAKAAVVAVAVFHFYYFLFRIKTVEETGTECAGDETAENGKTAVSGKMIESAEAYKAASAAEEA